MGSTPIGGKCPNDFSDPIDQDIHTQYSLSWKNQSQKPEFMHPVCSELASSGIRVVVGDCSVTEHWQWHPPYQTGKTVHVHAKGN